MTAIQVHNISKRYLLGERLPNSLRDVAARLLKFRGSGSAKDEFWALKDLSFDVAEGDTLGIIGRNGAGKSTLLKILSRITKPTSGSAKIHGRVGSLLEVGTGFHNELTGRENIYMNGAILGMKRTEIERKFDEIVAFSEIEQFLDTPVKHYSSGMYMRLAFSVAAHLEPEILIVDEVLAVGDTNFQKKCLTKMQDISEHGRTVLFVSHNMPSVARFCSRVIWIENGSIKADGDTNTVIEQYLSSGSDVCAEKIWTSEQKPPGNETVDLQSVRAVDLDGQVTSMFDVRTPVVLEMTYTVKQGGKVMTPGFHVYDEQGVCLFGPNDISLEWRRLKREPGTYVTQVTIPSNLMAEGRFYVDAVIFGPYTSEVHVEARDTISFGIFDPVEGDSARGDYGGTMIGAVRPLLDWKTEIKR